MIARSPIRRSCSDNCRSYPLRLWWLVVCVGGLGWSHLASPALSQPAKRLAVGDVQLSIALRVKKGVPRFVPAGRIVEDGDQPTLPLQPPPEIVEYFSQTADRQIAEIDHVCPLDERLKAKLKLAAMGDMSRLAREARELQAKYSSVSFRNQGEVLAAAGELGMINLHLREAILRDGSMFLMVLKGMLSDQQLETVRRARFLDQLAEWQLNLSDSQSEQLWQRICQKNVREVEDRVMWNEQQCQKLLNSISHDELVTFLERVQIEHLRQWCN